MRSGRLPDFPFRRSGHDRLSDKRSDDAFLDAAWKDPETRVLVLRHHDLTVTPNSRSLRFCTPAEAPDGPHLLLGAVDETTHFVVLADAESNSDLGPVSTLRDLADRLDEVDRSLAVHAVSLGGWHRRHPRCAVCGSLTMIAEGGATRRCPTCQAEHFPRTDPAVIMLVVDTDDRCLLGHNSARPEGWYSTLAGFVEPGESPEEAVGREVMEEAGITVDEVAYLGSQPWPFPSSLMLGFVATASSTDIKVDGVEITHARWFTRDELAREIEAGALLLPPTISIAGALVAHWYGGPLPDIRAG